MFRACTSSGGPQEEDKRHVWSNDGQANVNRCDEIHGALTNEIRTSKYTAIDFLPKNLFTQFATKIANIYFLILVIIMVIPGLSSIPVYSTLAPLLAVLAFNAALEGKSDYERHVFDRNTNNQKVKALRGKKWKSILWSEVQVGDLLQLVTDDNAPADMVILSSTNNGESSGKCFIESKDLDGETNLKTRKPVQATQELQELSHFQNLKLEVECETPNEQLDHFEGFMTQKATGEKVTLFNDNIMLRGHVLRNTDTIHGLVVFCGRETKLMKNSGKSREKQTHLAQKLNSLVATILLITFVLCVIGAVTHGVWESWVGEDSFYLSRDGENVADDSAMLGLLNIFSTLIVLSTLVPISLYVTLEFVRQVQSLLIGYDLQMYYAKNDTPAVARTVTLTEELGQIEYVFSDKTGTLTDNIMKFFQCALGDNIYEIPSTVLRFKGRLNDVMSSSQEQITFSETLQGSLEKAGISALEVWPRVPNPRALAAAYGKDEDNWPAVTVVYGTRRAIDALNKLSEEGGVPPVNGLTCVRDKTAETVIRNEKVDNTSGASISSINEALDQKDPKVLHFFLCLAICHTVERGMPEGSDRAEFKSQSPDENALVEAARDMGVEFMGSHSEGGSEYYTVSCDNKEMVFKLLHVIPFNSDRKRMSIVLQGPVEGGDDGPVYLFSKGADSIMRERLNGTARAEFEVLGKKLDFFAKDGLRTLVFCQRHLSNEFYEEWRRGFLEAQQDLDNAKQRVADEAAKVEIDMDLIGASAIEDKLQQGVPETISMLRSAGIKVWMLTGDKRETAINIAKSCQLFSQHPDIIIDGEPWQQWSDEETNAWLRKQVPEMSSKDEAAINDYEIKGHELRDIAVSQLANVTPAIAKKIVDAAQALKPSQDGVKTQLDNARAAIQQEEKNGDSFEHALVIDATSMDFVLGSDPNSDTLNDPPASNCIGKEQQTKPVNLIEVFLAVSSVCKSVVCCRFRPKQKANIVAMYKKYKGAITLAVGDGANDVSMIKQAHVGVGISGFEGMQAVAASDYSIGQFRFLQRLLLVHGRWCYMRMGTFIRYFFYKNFALTFSQFFFLFFSAYSAQTIYDPVQLTLFNVLFASFPIVAMGILEQDVNDERSLKQFPMLYEAGIRGIYFKKSLFIASLLRGIYHAVVIFFVAVLVMYNSGQYEANGDDQGDYTSLSVTVGFTLVLVVNAQLAFETHFITWLNALCLVIGPILWLIVFSIYYQSTSEFFFSNYYGQFARTLGSGPFWLGLLLTLVLALLPTLGILYYYVYFKPTPVDIAREQVRLGIQAKKAKRKGKTTHLDVDVESPPRRPSSSLILPPMKKLSSYAFSHEEEAGHDKQISRTKFQKSVRHHRPSMFEPSLETQYINSSSVDPSTVTGRTSFSIPGGPNNSSDWDTVMVAEV